MVIGFNPLPDLILLGPEAGIRVGFQGGPQGKVLLEQASQGLVIHDALKRRPPGHGEQILPGVVEFLGPGMVGGPPFQSEPQEFTRDEVDCNLIRLGAFRESRQAGDVRSDDPPA